MMADELEDADYEALAGFRFELRRFLRFSEEAAHRAGITPQQHQALLAVRAGGDGGVLVGTLAERLFLKPNSASELVRRLVEKGLLVRQSAPHDGRQVRLVLSAHAHRMLASLSANHLSELRQAKPLLEKLLARL